MEFVQVQKLSVKAVRAKTILNHVILSNILEHLYYTGKHITRKPSSALLFPMLMIKTTHSLICF